MMKILFVLDPIKSLNPKTDSSLRLMIECIAKKAAVYVSSFENLSWKNDKVLVRVERVTSITLGELPTLGGREEFSLESFKIAVIRKDPPFDKSYVNLCWLLRLYEDKVFVTNAPKQLLLHHEKLLPIEGFLAGYLKRADLVPTLISQDRDAIVDFVRSLETSEIILKPFYGFAGHEIRKLSREHFLSAPADYLTSQDVMVQPFLPEVRTEGDRRVFIIGGKYRGDLVRLPQGTSVISNLARGGRAELRELSRAQKSVIKRVADWISYLKIDFAGVDLIGTKVSEVNITSPTVLVAYERLSGVNLARVIVDLWFKKVKK